MGDEQTTTTFHYPKKKYWKFKQVLALQERTVKEASNRFLDSVIEDHQDSLLREELANDKSPWEMWVNMKRRMGLDEAQSNH